MKTKYKFLMEVRETGSKKNLLPVEEVEFEMLSGGTQQYRLGKAKLMYRDIIKNKRLYVPKMREVLDYTEWYVDGVEI